MRQGAAPGRGRPEYEGRSEARWHVLGAGAVQRPAPMGKRVGEAAAKAACTTGANA
jgi:hypothetical protein